MAKGYSPAVEQKIMRQLELGRKHRKSIAKCANLPIGTVGAALAAMTKEGRVERIAPGTYKIRSYSQQRRIKANRSKAVDVVNTRKPVNRATVLAAGNMPVSNRVIGDDVRPFAGQLRPSEPAKEVTGPGIIGRLFVVVVFAAIVFAVLWVLAR